MFTYEEINMIIKFEFFSIKEMNKWIRKERRERREEGEREERKKNLGLQKNPDFLFYISLYNF
jgi:hypothetical protein